MAVNTPQTTTPTPIAYGTTVGTTSGPAFPGCATAGGAIFYNPSATVVIAVCPAVVNSAVLGVYSGSTNGVAVINGAGSITIAPGDKLIVDNLNVSAAFNAIASGPGGLLTVWVF